MDNQISFFLNGQPVTIQNPDPELLLIDYLRDPEVGLTGAKKGCGQGGCGACTVILSDWDEENEEATHRSINSCLRPVCSLGGLSITTIEGTGAVGSTSQQYAKFNPTFSRGGAKLTELEPSPEWLKTRKELQAFRANKVEKAVSQLKSLQRLHTKDRAHRTEVKNDRLPGQTQPDKHDGMNPVAHRLAINNGTQCGYCTTGFVMNMSAFLAANPSPTKQEIEDIFDGNICRCTGYRSILTGMKTFASDLTEKDIDNRMICETEDKCEQVLVNTKVNIPFPAEAQSLPTPTRVERNGKNWYTPLSIEELQEIFAYHAGENIRPLFGNTSFGVYADEVSAATVHVDLKLLWELRGINKDKEGIRAGSLTTYSELLDYFVTNKVAESSNHAALNFMARRTAGMIVRNAGSIGGNTMLTLKHIHAGEPFPSDLLTALTATRCKIEYLIISTGDRYEATVEELVAGILDQPELVHDILLLTYHFPASAKNEIALAQKVALRQVNSHSIVNCTTRYALGKGNSISEVEIVFGGIAPFPWRASMTEKLLKGQQLSMDLVAQALRTLSNEVTREQERWSERLAGLPSEGLENGYRLTLAKSFLYKSIVNALEKVQPKAISAEIKSSGQVKWGNWGVTSGQQFFEDQKWRAPVARPIIKLMAFHQAMGQVHYTHEIELPPLGKNAAFIQSRRALANFHFIVPGRKSKVNSDRLRLHLAQEFAGFYELITSEDIPKGGVNYQGMGGDQPLFAVDRVNYAGQVIAMVIADSEQEAIRIAEYASDNCVGYDTVKLPKGKGGKKAWGKEWTEPILSIDKAIERKSIFPDAPKSAAFVSHIWKITRPGSDLSWSDQARDVLDKKSKKETKQIDQRNVIRVTNNQVAGGQIHFYMETQSCVAYPEDGDRMIVHPSSQSPNAMHQTAAMAIGSEHNKIDVAIRQLGGGYGGKTEQTRFVIGPTAVAAKVLNIPIRLAMKREHDSEMIGKRHAYYGNYQVAVDPGKFNETDRGLIRGLDIQLYGDGGAFYDCSFVVSNCIQLRLDNAYNIKNFNTQLDVCRTNTAPNTAMRAFGDVQGKLILENAIDDAAYAVDMDPYELRKRNMYYRGDVTPFGQALSYCYMRDVWDYCLEKSNYSKKVDDVAEFNKANKWTKRGVYMLPVKYGSGYNLKMIEQATAMVSIYSGDGSVVINQGAIDMGQGAHTQIEQIAAYVLNVPMEMIQVLTARTSSIPNPTSTGGSTGTAYHGEAVKQACEVMRARLLEFGQSLLRDNGQEWCVKQGINYWDFPNGWAAEVELTPDHPTLIWQHLITLAYQYRIELVSTFNAKITGGSTPVPVMTFKQADEQPQIPFIENTDPKVVTGSVDSFNGFTFSAACAMVEVDVLTGETKILSADLVYDMGYSLNPAIDIGQVEGAFMQGVGYVMTEKLVFEPDGEEKGRLNTVNTWRYKPPAITTIPLELNTYLYPRSRSSEVPVNPNGILSAKEVGEPPLVLATSVFFAIKAAVRASRLERKLNGLFKMDAPATVQEVSKALEVRARDFK
ncbi:xanthine dehydrogenase [Lewinellaceae bacterium SD302]|nr:xanthine dehydrogenase [Lewinellaceae bacterium SD302]